MTVHVAHTNVLLLAFTSLDKLKHIEPPSGRSRSPCVPVMTVKNHTPLS
jgi:hypothetical protein